MSRVAQVYSEALDFLFVAFYESQGYGGGIRIPLHTRLRIKCYPKEKANVIVDCLEDQFSSHDLCDDNLEQYVGTRILALLASVDDSQLGKIKPCDIHKLVNSLKQKVLWA
jgi:hypothetical protein